MGLPEDLEGHLPETLRRLVPRRYDVIGDIAVLSLPGELRGYGPGIAEIIRTKRKHIRTVMNKVTMISGENRLAAFEIFAGCTTVTTHREFGIPYRLDLARVFFNPCLAYERNRVAMQGITGETVLVPFAGIGPFVLPLAKKGVFVVAVEKNPEAVRWLRENLRINNAEEMVDVIEGDARDTTLYGNRTYDRVVIPAPYGMDTSLDIVTPLVRYQGKVHYYTFRRDGEIPGLIGSFRKKGLETVLWRRCGNVAPGVCRLVFDLVKLR